MRLSMTVAFNAQNVYIDNLVERQNRESREPPPQHPLRRIRRSCSEPRHIARVQSGNHHDRFPLRKLEVPSQRHPLRIVISNRKQHFWGLSNAQSFKLFLDFRNGTISANGGSEAGIAGVILFRTPHPMRLHQLNSADWVTRPNWVSCPECATFKLSNGKGATVAVTADTSPSPLL